MEFNLSENKYNEPRTPYKERADIIRSTLRAMTPLNTVKKINPDIVYIQRYIEYLNESKGLKLNDLIPTPVVTLLFSIVIIYLL